MRAAVRRPMTTSSVEMRTPDDVRSTEAPEPLPDTSGVDALDGERQLGAVRLEAVLAAARLDLDGEHLAGHHLAVRVPELLAAGVRRVRQPDPVGDLEAEVLAQVLQ